MKFLRKLYFSIFKCYKRLELKCVSYDVADRLITGSVGKPEAEQWVLAKEEDSNKKYGMVYIERRLRIRK